MRYREAGRLLTVSKVIKPLEIAEFIEQRLSLVSRSNTQEWGKGRSSLLAVSLHVNFASARRVDLQLRAEVMASIERDGLSHHT